MNQSVETRVAYYPMYQFFHQYSNYMITYRSVVVWHDTDNLSTFTTRLQTVSDYKE